MGRLNIKSKSFKEYHQRRLDEKKYIASKNEEKRRIVEEKERQQKIQEEIVKKYSSDWRNELVIPVAEKVVEVQEPKVKKILEVNREKGGIVGEEFVEKVISEGMTSSGMFQTTLPAEGDVALGNASGWVDSSESEDVGGVSVSGDTIVITPNNIPIGNTGGSYQQAIGNSVPFDATNMTTAKVTLIRTRAGVEDSNIRLFANYGSDPNQFYINAYFGETGSASRLINIANYQNLDKLRFQIRASSNKKWSIDDPNDPDYGSGEFIPVDTSDYTLKIEYQRRTPVNVFVSLDSPEATAFIRTDPIMRGLSAAERYKKLEDLLNAGDEYILKALGMQSSPTRPADTGKVKSWDQAANEVDYGEDLTPLSDNPYGTELGQIAMAGDMDMGGLGLLGMGIEGLAAAASLGVAGLMAAYNMSKEMATWLVNKYSPDAGKAVRDAQDYERGTSEQQKQETAEADQKLKDATAELEAANASGDPERIARAEERRTNAVKNRQRVRNKWKTNRQNQKNSYEPTGEILTEKKRLKSPKDLQNKIPGYYDGKPSPLGFPMEPPAKMINGFHSDLVTPEGQEKQSNRYNRMDQATAKAMPMTDNPHINKKIIKARLQPK
jgi:hypothetical protein